MTAHAHPHDHHAESILFGFWTYILTDIILFATLFATYAVLRPSAEMLGVSGPKELFNLPLILLQTFLLLTSSLTIGLAVLSQKSRALLWMGATAILGGSFLSLEMYEFYHLMRTGNGPQTSAFMSGFFGLVGTHGLHVFIGLIWLIALWLEIARRGLGALQECKLKLFALFWHFLDIIWIFVFTFVYLTGVI